MILFFFFKKSISRTYFPKSHHIVQELQFIGRQSRKAERKKMKKMKKPLVQRDIRPSRVVHERNQLRDSRYTGYAFSEDENAAQALHRTITSPSLKRESTDIPNPTGSTRLEEEN